MRIPHHESSGRRRRPLAAAGDALDDDLRGAASFGIAGLVGETDDGVGIADVHVGRVGTEGIKGDAEWPAQSRRKVFFCFGFAVAVRITQNS